MKTREQLRAERASSLVASVKADQVSAYTKQLHSFPALVHENGLGPALAFLKAKKLPEQVAVYNHLSEWVSEAIYNQPKAELLTLIVENSAEQMMRAHDESLMFLNWLLRFAEAREPKARKA